MTTKPLRKIFGFKTERTSYLPEVESENKSPEIKSDFDNNNGEDAGKGDTEENSDDLVEDGTDENLMDSASKPVGDKRTRKGRKFSAKDYKDAVLNTTARILDLILENQKRKEKKESTGIYTSAILSKLLDFQIAIFFTGKQHAGENLDDDLDNRPEGMAIPTQMCDASNNNSPERNEIDEGNCHAHLRRKFFEIAEIWPTYILPIIAFLNTLFSNGREAKEEGLYEAQTFAQHKMKSAPVIDELKSYCRSPIDDKKTEPNSDLGKAIN